MEDIIETLLGLEIVDEKDTHADMQEYARQRWKARQTKYNFPNYRYKKLISSSLETDGATESLEENISSCLRISLRKLEFE